MSVIYTLMYILCLSATMSDAFVRRTYHRITHRQVNVVLKNHCTSHKLQNPGLYLYSGLSTVPMPPVIGPNHETHVEFRKARFARGAVGVFGYDVVDTATGRVDKRLALMFSVPFNYLFHSNWFAAGFYPKGTASDRNLYRAMYYGNEGAFVRRKAGRLVTHKDGAFTVKATMTNTRTPQITLEVYDQ